MNNNKLIIWMIVWISMAVIHLTPTPVNSSRSIHRHFDRLALVIGNAEYTKAGRLANPVNDARDMAQKLESLDFVVRLLTNATQRDMEDAIRQFGKELSQEGVGLFYFAGHGISVNKVNYLIPIDARIEKETDVKYESVAAGKILDEMGSARNSVNIVILDACRNNNLTRSFRNARKGLSEMHAPTGSIIAYATQPGAEAADGVGMRNSIYTSNLLKALDQPCLLIEQVFKKVRKEVIDSTNNIQVPTESTNLVGDFYFSRGGCGQVEQPGPTGLKITCNVRGANVYLSGRSVGKTPLESKTIATGVYDLKVEAYGYLPMETQVRVNPGMTLEVPIHLIKKSGDIKISGHPSGANIFLDNAYSGVLPLTLKDVKTGPHQIVIQAKGYKDWKKTIHVKTGQHLPIYAKLEPKDTGQWVSPSTGMTFVYIPPGEFKMGYSGSQHDVRLFKGYYLQTTEVTQGQWKAVMGNNPSRFKNCGDQCPVEKVSWNDVQKFIQNLNQKGEAVYRLPTEAEWEYAARAGTTTAYSFGDDSYQLIKYGNFCDSNCTESWKDSKQNDQFINTAPVKSYLPNAWGLYDMHGNVYEWCSDWYGDYPTNRVIDPKGAQSADFRLLRGGSWYDYAWGCRSAYRYRIMPGNRYSDVGVRLAVSLSSASSK